MEHNFISISRYSDSVPHMCKKHSSTIFCKEILCAFEVHTKTEENKKSFIKKIITLIHSGCWQISKPRNFEKT